MAIRTKVWLTKSEIQTIRYQATKLLRALQYSGGQVNIERIATNLGASVKYAPYNGSDMAGALIRSAGTTVIAVNSAHHKNRQRFTIAHECGHLLLHSPSALFVDQNFSIQHRDSISSLAIDRLEVEANQFAAEILMPYTYVRRDIGKLSIDLEDDTDVAKLAKKYVVSSQAMTYRIANMVLE